MDILLLSSLFLLGENDLWFVTSWSMTGELADIKYDYTLSEELDAEELQACSFQVTALRHQEDLWQELD